MYKFLLSTAALVCLCFFAKAQSATPGSLTDYSFEIQQRIGDMNTYLQLSSGKQMSLAAFFKKAEDATHNSQVNKFTGQQILALRAQLKAEFQSLLTAQELSVFSQNHPESEYAKQAPAPYASPAVH